MDGKTDTGGKIAQILFCYGDHTWPLDPVQPSATLLELFSLWISLSLIEDLSDAEARLVSLRQFFWCVQPDYHIKYDYYTHFFYVARFF